MHEFLVGLGCWRCGANHEKYVLDGLDPEFFLCFDADDDPETPEAKNTVDVLVGTPGESACDGQRILASATICDILILLKALRINPYPDNRPVQLKNCIDPVLLGD